MEQKDNHRTTGRALDVLELVVAGEGGLTLSALCAQLNVPKSSMFPIVHTLLRRGYLTQEKYSQRYRIGPMAFRIGSAYLNENSTLDEVQRLMETVVAGCSETCHFGTLQGGDVFYLKKVDSPEPIRMMSTAGKTLPAYATGLGKALLADYDAAQLRRLYHGGLIALTEYTVTDFTALAEQLARIRAEGFAYECEESNRSIRCIAVPIRKDGAVVASMSIAIPIFRYTDALGETVKRLLDDARNELETLIRGVDIDF